MLLSGGTGGLITSTSKRAAAGAWGDWAWVVKRDYFVAACDTRAIRERATQGGAVVVLDSPYGDETPFDALDVALKGPCDS